MLTQVYHRHLTTCLSKTEYLILSILLNLLQTIKQVKLETLAASFPLPILFESRRKKLQRFLESQFLTIEALWLPIISQWIQTEFKSKEVISIVIDRTQWATINILMVSLVFNNRAIPLYFELIDHVGNSDLQYQQSILSRVLSFLKQYTVVVLGDREFCSVELARWLTLQGNVYFCLRLKKNTYIQVEKDNWTTLHKLGLRPGISFYYQGVKVTKTKGFQPVNVVGKWKRKYQGVTAKEGWFILTNFEQLEQAISAYQRRMGIEEMFRDFKMGGYKLEASKLSGHRLYSLILLIVLAYSEATLAGRAIKVKGVAKYIGRTKTKEKHRSFRRHSDFYLGFNAPDWLLSCQLLATEADALMQLSPHKSANYQRGLRATSLIQSVF